MAPLKLPQSYIARIPTEYKREYINVVCRENFLRMFVIATLLAVVEPFLAFLAETPGTADSNIALGISLGAMALLPVLHLSKRNAERLSKFWIMAIQTLFLVGILAGGIILSLYEQSTLASSSSYFLGLFTIAAFITIPPDRFRCFVLDQQRCVYGSAAGIPGAAGGDQDPEHQHAVDDSRRMVSESDGVP